MADRDRAAANDTDSLPQTLTAWAEAARRRAQINTVTFGDWVLGTNANGDAILTYAPTGAVTVLAIKP